MRKQCNQCLFSKEISDYNRKNGFSVDDVVLIPPEKFPKDCEHVICVLKHDIHRDSKEQRKCSLYERKEEV